MEQHPVPQNIASFKFKLFGSLTARQFFTLIIPLSFAALVFFSNIPVFVRMPLSLILGIIAFVVALVPINGQPFDKWAVAFIKAVMSPTQRVWIKEKKVPDFLSVIVTPPVLEETIPEELSSQKRAKLFAYIKSLPEKNASPLDVKEQIALKDIDYSVESVLSTQPFPKIKAGVSPPPIIWPAQPIRPQITYSQNYAKPSVSATIDQIWSTPVQTIKKIPQPASPAKRGEPLSIRAKIEPASPPRVPAAPPLQTGRPKISYHVKPYVLHGIEKRLAIKQVPQPEPASQYVELIPTETTPAFKQRQSTKTPSVNLASDTNYSLDNIIPVKLPNNKIRLLHGIGKTRARKLHFAPPENFDLSKLPIRGEKRFEVSDELKQHFQFEDTTPEVILPFGQISAPVPQVQPVKISQKPAMPSSVRVVPKSSNRPYPLKSDSGVMVSGPIASSQKFSVTDFNKDTKPKGNLTSAEIIPLTSTPNVISGQVTDSLGTPITGAVIVVRDAFGIPLRALKTNKLGQFLSATPLSAGTYTIETESELAVFEPLRLDLKNEIVPPIAIVAEQVIAD